MRCDTTVFAVILHCCVVRRRHITVVPMRYGGVHSYRCERFRLMACTKRRDSHRLHTERQTQEQKQQSAKLAKMVHSERCEV